MNKTPTAQTKTDIVRSVNTILRAQGLPTYTGLAFSLTNLVGQHEAEKADGRVRYAKGSPAAKRWDEANQLVKKANFHV